LSGIYMGVGLIIGLFWFAALFFPLIILMEKGVIAREEAYLERKFGEEYRAYKARVRRWI